MIVSKVNVKDLRARGYRNLEHWLETPTHLYVGRQNAYVKGAQCSKWRNPYSVKKFGLDECLAMYEDHIRSNLWDDLYELDEYIDIGCWCIHSLEEEDKEICHAQVLRRLYYEQLEEQGEA